VIFFSVSRSKIAAPRALFPGWPRNSGTVADHPTCSSKKSVPVVAEMPDQLHNKLGRGLRPITKVSVPFVTDSPELVDVPSHAYSYALRTRVPSTDKFCLANSLLNDYSSKGFCFVFVTVAVAKSLINASSTC
jgi:hypothetical protein